MLSICSASRAVLSAVDIRSVDEFRHFDRVSVHFLSSYSGGVFLFYFWNDTFFKKTTSHIRGKTEIQLLLALIQARK